MNAGAAARRKGQRFQREVARLLEADGWHVQNIGSGVSGCDLIAVRNGTTLAIETKYQERAKYPEWWRQTVASCPEGARPVLVHKQTRWPIKWISLHRHDPDSEPRVVDGQVLWVTSEPPQ